MAERRMFARTIIGSDAFLDMPQSTQCLYFHLNMRADDDGFINSPKSVMREVGCKDDDIKLLIAKHFIIPFESGVVVIKHWKIHNYIQSDRYHETKYLEEKAGLIVNDNRSYSHVSKMDTECIQLVSKMDTEIRLDKTRLELEKIRQEKTTRTSYATVDTEPMPEEARVDEMATPMPNLISEDVPEFDYPQAIYDAWQRLGDKAYQPPGFFVFQARWGQHVSPFVRGIHSKDVLTALANFKAIIDAPAGTYYWSQKVGVQAFFEKHLEKFLPGNFNADDFKARQSFEEIQAEKAKASVARAFQHLEEDE